MQVTLSERAAELAAQAVEQGLCDTVDDAVERGLEALASSLAVANERWSPEYAAEVNEGVKRAREDVAAGRVVVADEAFWERMRSLVADRPHTTS